MYLNEVKGPYSPFAVFLRHPAFA